MSETLIRHRAGNLVRSSLLLLAMAAVLAFVGWLLGGATGAGLSLALAAAFAWLAPGVSVERLLRARGARPLHPSEVPGVQAAVRELSARAGLHAPPRVFVVPLPGPQAIATESADGAALAVSPSLVRVLSPRELVAVLAHEIAHLKHRDIGLMRLAETVSRATRAMSSFGLLLLVLNLPLMVLAGVHVPWLGVLALVVAPWAVGLLSLALSRAREHDADAGAVALTRDPLALASALTRIEAATRGSWWTLVLGTRPPEALRSHPSTAARVARLRTMVAGPPLRTPDVIEPVWIRAAQAARRGPRRIVVA